jgi:hypothetical protein
LSAFGFAALIGVAVPNYAGAQSALNTMDTSARTVQVSTIEQMIDAMGNLVDGEVSPGVASALTADGGRLNAALKPGPDAASAVMFNPLTIGGGIMVTFSNGMLSEISDQVTTIDPMTGAARVMRTASGTITINVNVAGLMIMQPIMFNLIDFAATDMGPLFIADRAPRMAPMGMGMPANPAGMDFSNVAAGARVICAKTGSPFLMMMDLAIANCDAMVTRTDPMTMMMTSSPAFMNPRQIDPKPFDPMTGEIRPVGVSVIRVAPFMIAGIPININPIVRFKLDGAQRITEGN